MVVINCYYVMDGATLCELMSARDIEGLNVYYLQPTVTLSQKQLMTHSQRFEYPLLSSNLSDG